MTGVLQQGFVGTRPCEAGQHQTRWRWWQVAGAVGGLGLLGAGVGINVEDIPIGQALILLGGLLLLVTVAWPYVTGAELDVPLIGSVAFAANARKERVRTVVNDARGLLLACAAHLCPDDASAVRVVESCVSKGVGNWRGADDASLRTYLLCLLVHEARFESSVLPAPDIGAKPLMTLSPVSREVFLLSGRAELPATTVAAILGIAAEDVPSIRDQAAEMLRGGGVSP